MLEQLIKEDLVYINLPFKNRDDLFRYISDELKEKGYVKDTFYRALTERENTYPTGIQLSNFSVAIPHGNPEQINKPFVALVTLDTPIKINRIDEPEELLDVKLLFFLGIKDGSQHLDLLKALMGMLQNEPDFIIKITEVHSTQEVLSLLN